jgi:signal transduction histidine kinase
MRFFREAQITGQLEHPGIVPVYELARRPQDQQSFYTMRLIQGRTLSAAARAYHQQRRLTGQVQPSELFKLLNAFVTVCNTVAYAHSRGVLHRDLKGQNVVLGNFGEVIVLDWGLAKLMNRPETEAPASVILEHDLAAEVDLTVAGQLLGTPAYMAPEQAMGRLDLVDHRTDVYGLGAILYEILTGQPPFTGADQAEILRKVQEEEPIPPMQYWGDVPPWPQRVCLRCLAKNGAERYPSVRALAEEMQGWLSLLPKHTQDLRQETEKFVALGACVPGVVNEINNPLASVTDNLVVLQRDVQGLCELLRLFQEGEATLALHHPALSSRVADLKESIDLTNALGNLDGLMTRSRDGLQRIQYIVKALHDFARLDDSDLKEMNLNAGIESTVNIIRGEARKRQVEMKLELAELPEVTCYPARINQVVLNLVVNALQACSEGGKLTVRTTVTPDGVALVVEDTGCGIDPAIRDKIFDPFFTTKPPGEGQGTGLAFTYQIVQEHLGRIDVDSVLGQGSRFTVHLPLKHPMTGVRQLLG